MARELPQAPPIVSSGPKLGSLRIYSFANNPTASASGCDALVIVQRFRFRLVLFVLLLIPTQDWRSIHG